MTDNIRRRLIWSIAMLLICGAGGWASRHWPTVLPMPIRKRSGDALWASCIFFLITIVRPRWPTARAAMVALAIAFTIEFGQIYHGSPWLENLRKTLFGRLVLGSGFSWLDQLAYIVGVIAVVPVDWCVVRELRRSTGGRGELGTLGVDQKPTEDCDRVSA